VPGVSLERALCAVDVPAGPAAVKACRVRRCLSCMALASAILSASDAPIDTESGSTVIGGTPAMPRIELSSARFSARSRATSASSARVYRVAVSRRQIG
jgi:hypothetical protein